MNIYHQKDLITSVYRWFNERQLSAILEVLHPEVIWPNGMEGGTVHGREGVQEYWTRQWAMINPKVEPLYIVEEPDGRMLVRVHQLVKDLEGRTLVDQLVEHVYAFEEGMIIDMEIREVPKQGSISKDFGQTDHQNHS
jgi:hypothetical protein